MTSSGRICACSWRRSGCSNHRGTDWYPVAACPLRPLRFPWKLHVSPMRGISTTEAVTMNFMSCVKIVTNELAIFAYILNFKHDRKWKLDFWLIISKYNDNFSIIVCLFLIKYTYFALYLQVIRVFLHQFWGNFSCRFLINNYLGTTLLQNSKLNNIKAILKGENKYWKCFKENLKWSNFKQFTFSSCKVGNWIVWILRRAKKRSRTHLTIRRWKIFLFLKIPYVFYIKNRQ